MTQKKTYVRDLSEGQNVADIFALAQAQRREAKNGPYWQLSLMDRTGQMEARLWFPQSQQFEALKPEQFVLVHGQVASFKNQLQMNITDMSLMDPAGVDMADFLPASAVPPAEILTAIESLLEAELTFKPWLRLCEKVLADPGIRAALLTAPGAKAIHHAYAGGLLEHTLGIMRLCLAIAGLYPGVDKEILLVAALFHDLGKAFELSHGLSREYTDAGRLLGHIHLGLETVDPFLRKAKDLPAELIMHLKHLILAHHGELEFGSPRRPKTVEAFVLHYADNLDAKINTVEGALAGPDEPDEPGHWSEYNRTLARYLYQPMRTPRKVPESRPCKRNPEPSPLLRAMGIHTT